MANTYELISSSALTADTATIVISSIPATYDDLRIFLTARSVIGNGAVQENVSVQFNASSANFTSRRFYGDGATLTSDAPSGNINTSIIPASGATASVFGQLEMIVMQYANTTYNKSFLIDSIAETNGSTKYSTMYHGLWSQTSAITSITFTLPTGVFATHSTVSVYGISKGSDGVTAVA